jgi:NADPH2:quinone reductase
MASSNGQVKGIVVTANGDASVLKLDNISPAAPGPGQALVRVHAAGLNYIDIYQREGKYPTPLPYTPGLEAAGVVEAIGEGVTEAKVGDRVAYNGELGAYAELALVKSQNLIPLPDELSFVQGAAFPLQGMTAHYLLHEFRKPEPGMFVLVHAAAGGMGLLLSQWLKHKGAVVIGTTSSADKAAQAKEAGCDYVINYTSQDFVKEVNRITDDKGCPIVIDGVGKSTFPGSMAAASKRGSVIIFGSASGSADPIGPNDLQKKSLTISGGSLFNYLDNRDELLRRSGDVLHGIKEGWLKLNISAVMPLAKASEAHKLLESRKSTGKIILTCQ